MIAAALALASAGTTYYVDPDRGRDAATGRSPGEAWRSLARLAELELRPGDRVLLAGGRTVAGPLRLRKGTVGEAERPVTLGSYGRGRARIAGEAGDGGVLDGVRHVTVQDLEFVGDGRDRNDGRGLLLRGTRHVRVENVLVKGFRQAGLETGGDQDTLIQGVDATENGGAGITVFGGWGDVPRSERVTIRRSRAWSNPGDPKNLGNHSGNGIVVGGVTECLIEECAAWDNGAEMPWQGNGPVGIWAWSADRVTIRRCVSFENRSPGLDGGGFDLDGGVTNSVIEDCLSYGNDGPGYLMCHYSGAGSWTGNVVRRCVSYEDGRKNTQAGIALYDHEEAFGTVLFERNTVVNAKHAITAYHAVPGATYRRNVFLAGEGATFTDNFESGDAMLVLPTALSELPRTWEGLATMPYFRPKPGSPLLQADPPYGALAPLP